ncbi:serine/threonine protein phosphatase [Actinomadura sp. KC06]|uniref:PP2C family serine/threonine-protein phosphatase n=1 Tax=Actinomadura sp. KC06 TaxID=2530369 RepID=UPI00104BA24C|nr:protein phosphatase 2C domain-containing protein [Actinomadura sp. KC06]TDD19964.1 serine/threonine protein phosphatase [Actinomadura sp. KC06]
MDADQHTHAGLCRTCGEPVHARDRFCEQCGRPDPTAPDRTCADCGTGAIGTDGYCDQCGFRRPSGREHVEAELGGFVAAVSDIGLKRKRNEDAFTLAPLPSGACAVVCDGVATAPGSAEASRLAAEAAASVLAGRVSVGMDPEAATRAAAERAAEVVASLIKDPKDLDGAPACTFASAVVDGAGVTVGWVGDSRVYWLSSAASFLLTRDDSWAAQMIERGQMSAADAWADRRAHLLTAWLGADAGIVKPQVAAFRPAGPGMVLICSDGLWNDLPEAADLAAVALKGEDGEARPEVSGGRTVRAARRLLRAALDAGGHDNVTAVVIAWPPPGSPPPGTSREPGR